MPQHSSWFHHSCHLFPRNGIADMLCTFGQAWHKKHQQPLHLCPRNGIAEMLCAFGQAWHKQHQLPMHSCLAQQIHGSTNSVTSLFPQFSKFKTRIPRFCKKGSPISHLGFELLRLQKKLLTLVRFLHQKSTLQWTKSNSKHHWLCNINAWCRSCCFPMFPEAIGQLLMMLMMKPRATRRL